MLSFLRLPWQGLQCQGLEGWGEPSKTAEMLKPDLTFLMENGIGPVLVLIGIRRRRGGEASRTSNANIREKGLCWQPFII